MNGVLHLDFRPGRANWILRLMSRLDSSRAAELKRRRRQWASLSLGERAGAVATRMRAVEVVTRRLDNDLVALGEELKQASPRAVRCIKEGLAYTTRNRDLAYELLVDVDGFLFETRSAYELTVKFVAVFLSRILDRAVPEKMHLLHGFVAHEVSRRGGETSWIDELRTHRNVFVHETAPWPALEIVSIAPLRAELVLLKKNVKDLREPQTYLHIDQCRRMYSGFLATFPILEDWLTAEIRSFEARSHQC